MWNLDLNVAMVIFVCSSLYVSEEDQNSNIQKNFLNLLYTLVNCRGKFSNGKTFVTAYFDGKSQRLLDKSIDLLKLKLFNKNESRN